MARSARVPLRLVLRRRPCPPGTSAARCPPRHTRGRSGLPTGPPRVGAPHKAPSGPLSGRVAGERPPSGWGDLHPARYPSRKCATTARSDDARTTPGMLGLSQPKLDPGGVRAVPYLAAYYAPTGGRQRICTVCRDGQATGANCSTCGSLVSGRARWGATWGGECDRAEARADALMAMRSLSPGHERNAHR